MAPAPDPGLESSFQFVLAVLSTCGNELHPDYHKVCDKVGISHARTVYSIFSSST